jgi:tRNA dimethylallyltransferase
MPRSPVTAGAFFSLKRHSITLKGVLGDHNLIVVLGATASGKTEFAVRLARSVDGEIISADSRQVYRGMDLGTGKDLAVYSHGGLPVPYHLIDILDPREEFSVFAFRERFYHCFRSIHDRGHVPLLVGGTGLYVDAVVRNYALPKVPENQILRESLEGEEMETLRSHLLALSPNVHNSTDLLNRVRLLRAIEIAAFLKNNPHETGASTAVKAIVLGIRCQRNILHQRIADRLDSRLTAGMIEEVRRLHENGIDWGKIDSFGLEYRYIGCYLQGVMTREAMIQMLNARIRQFAKRQETWFRRMEKRGVRIHWIDPKEEISEILGKIALTQ